MIRRHLFFIAFFSIVLAIFLHPLITMRAGFLWGDSFLQFFPWFKCYAEAIKSFSLPYWASSMGSGFPLMAEGQVGGFYPLNMIFFFILPFEIAYNYSVIFHFMLGGVFTYIYARKLGSDASGGSLSALLFCFGSAYAGCFYNIITLRTLAWFPLVLYFIERYFDGERIKYIFFAGLILGLQLLAGFVQMAAYSAFFYLAYLLYRSFAQKTSVKRVTVCSLVFLAVSAVMAAPQLALTRQLAVFSGREAAQAGFALWGSVFPSGLLGIVFPYSFSFKGDIYVGILSLLFVIFALRSLKEDRRVRGLVLLLILSAFFALGGYNPVYSGILKITKLYIFRNPSKFLFFGSFSLSILAGIGLTGYFNGNVTSRRKAVSTFLVLLSIAAAVFFTVKAVMVFFKKNILEFADHYVRSSVYNQPHHRYGLEFYLEKARLAYEGFLAAFSFSNIFVILSWSIFITAVLFCFFPLRKRGRQAAIALILADIFIFSFYGKGFSHNINSFDSMAPGSPRILNILRSDRDIYRIFPFDLKSGKLPNWSQPNANMTYGIESVACYTPLAGRAYRDRLTGFEAVDDSLGLKDADEGAFKDKTDVLRLLNVKYIISPKPLNEGSLEKVAVENGLLLYRLDGYLPRVFFTRSITMDIKSLPDADIKIVSRKDGFIEFEVSANENGFVVFSENYYPGWRAFVDGREAKVAAVKDVVQAISLKKGHHGVVFVYKPDPLLVKR